MLHILDLLASAGVQAWLDGGWGVDALLGRISRVHNDLDLVLDLDDLNRAVQVLQSDGFAIEEDELGRVVLLHADHGRLDLHPVTYDAHGNGVQVQPAEVPLVYPKEGFVSGTIDGHKVGCISAQVQMAVRLGFDPSEKHRRDAIELSAAFGLPLPEPWLNESL